MSLVHRNNRLTGRGQRGGKVNFGKVAKSAWNIAKKIKPATLANAILDSTGASNTKYGKPARAVTGTLSRFGLGSSGGRRRTRRSRTGRGGRRQAIIV